MKNKTLHCLLRNALWLIAYLAIGLILGLNILFLSEVAYDSTERVTISSALLQTIPLSLAAVLLAAIVSRLDGGLEKVNQRKLFCILSAIYAGIALYFVLNIDPILRADAKLVHQAAQNVLAGIYTDFEKGGYLYRYPHQLGLTLYDSILALYSSNPLLNMLLNFLLVLGIDYTAFRISQELFQNRVISLLTMLCSFAFLPQLFFILFVYGLIPGLFCMISAFYHTLRFTREKKIKNLIALVLFCAGAVVLKSNYAIGTLAIAIYLVLHMLKEKATMKMAVALLSVLLCLVVPNWLVKGYYGAVTGADLSQGTPAILWVAMGTNIDNNERGPGWYNSTNYTLYNQAEYDREAAGELGMEVLRNNLEKIRQRPKDALDFFLNKTISQWCDPLHQSLWSGPMEAFGQGIHTELLKSIYHDQLPEDILTVVCKFVTLVIFTGVFVFLIFFGKKAEGWELFLMYFLGGLIFHTFWEGKSQYTYPYVFCLIPCAMAGFWELSQKMKRLFSK
ncbi:MAG: hypothetical protein SOX71_09945 [Candidatus Faecousia sp.]|nr:hypothetical protein [Candidatus Faecousia sp.]